MKTCLEEKVEIAHILTGNDERNRLTVAEADFYNGNIIQTLRRPAMGRCGRPVKLYSIWWMSECFEDCAAGKGVHMAERRGHKEACRDQQDNRLDSTKEKSLREEDHIGASDGISPADFKSEEGSEVLAHLEKQMDEDIEALLNDQTPVKPCHFSEDYEKKLEQSLTEKFGTVQAQLILEARRKVRENAEQEYRQYMMSEDFLPSSYADKSEYNSDTSTTEHISLDTLHNTQKRHAKSSMIPMKKAEKTSKVHHGITSKLASVGRSKAVKAASVLLAAAVLTLAFNKDVANAYWWEDLSFLMENFDEYSELDIYNVIKHDDAEYPDTIETVYVPTVVAEGYEVESEEVLLKQVRIVYVNQDNVRYTFLQETQDMGQHINTENTEQKVYKTLFGDAYYTENMGEFQLSWYYENYVFSIQGNLNLEDMIKIANSVILKDREG